MDSIGQPSTDDDAAIETVCRRSIGSPQSAMLRFFSAIDASDRRGREHRVSLPSRAETFAEDFNENNLVAPTGFEPVFQP